MEIKYGIGYYNESGCLEFFSLHEESDWADREFVMWFLEEKGEMIEMEEAYERGWSRRLLTLIPVVSRAAQRIAAGKYS